MVSTEEVKEAVNSIPTVDTILQIDQIAEGANETYKVDVGEVIYVKFCTDTPAESFRSGAIVSEYVNDYTQVSAPEVLHTDWSKDIVETDWYAAYEAEGVTVFSVPNEELDNILYNIGAEQAKLHRDSQTTGYGRISVTKDNSLSFGADNWENWIYEIARDGYNNRHSAFEDLDPSVEGAISEIPNAVPKNPPMSLLHGDYWTANIFCNPTTGEITDIIDWDWSAGGAPLFDLALSEYIITSPILQPEDTSEYRSGYMSERPIETDVFNSRKYNAYQLTALLWCLPAFGNWYSDSDEDYRNTVRDKIHTKAEELAKKVQKNP